MSRYVGRLADIMSGQLIRFRYNGGSNPGSIRTVRVESKGDYSILGIDQAANGYRQFNWGLICGTIEIMEEAEAKAVATAPRTQRVYFIDARNKLVKAVNEMTGEQLAEALGKLVKAEKATFAGGYVELTMPEPSFNVNGQTLTLTQLRQLVAQHS